MATPSVDAAKAGQPAKKAMNLVLEEAEVNRTDAHSHG